MATPGQVAQRHCNCVFCDAFVLGKYWKKETGDAKVIIGQMVMEGNEAVINASLRAAFAQHSCDQAFNFQDAPKIAELWSGAQPA